MAKNFGDLKDLEHAVVSDAVTAVDALIDVAEKGSTFLPKEAADLASELLGFLKTAKAKIEDAGGGKKTTT